MSKAPRSPGRIVVGVNRLPASRVAVLWAAQEANLRHDVLLVTHIDLPTTYAPELYQATLACHRLLVECATLASEAEPSVAVGTLLLAGRISDELIRLSRSAVLLVVGIEAVGRSGTGTLGSIEDRVVAEAHCPVVLVPDPAGSAETSWPPPVIVLRRRVAEPPHEAVSAGGL